MHRHVFSLTQHLIEDPIEEIINISPGYNSVLVRLNNKTKIRLASEILSTAVKRMSIKIDTKPRVLDIPVCYNSEYGPDQVRVMNHTGYSRSELVKRHSRGEYLVHFIGF